MASTETIIETVLQYYPATQAIYLYGTYGTEYERPDSDIDLALLLPHDLAKESGSLLLSPLHDALIDLVQREVDLVNARWVSTVLQKEIIAPYRRIYCADQYAADEFEMLVLSMYQRLNYERAGISEDIKRSGRVTAP